MSTASVETESVRVDVDQEYRHKSGATPSHYAWVIDVRGCGDLTDREAAIIAAVEDFLTQGKFHFDEDTCHERAERAGMHWEEGCPANDIKSDLADLKQEHDGTREVLEVFHRKYHDDQFPAEFCQDSMCRNARGLL
jgi:hypothetical protein